MKTHLASHHPIFTASCLQKGEVLTLANEKQFGEQMHSKRLSPDLCKKCKRIYRQLYK